MRAENQPQPRVQSEQTANSVINSVEMPFTDDDGWCKVTVGWHDDQVTNDAGERVGCWIAQCESQGGCFGHSEASQLHAMAELVRSLAALCDMYAHMETERHRAVWSSPDVLAKEIREAESDLHIVQRVVTSEIADADKWDRALKPLWRAERALRDFAARIVERSRTAQTPEEERAR